MLHAFWCCMNQKKYKIYKNPDKKYVLYFLSRLVRRRHLCSLSIRINWKLRRLKIICIEFVSTVLVHSEEASLVIILSSYAPMWSAGTFLNSWGINVSFGGLTVLQGVPQNWPPPSWNWLLGPLWNQALRKFPGIQFMFVKGLGQISGCPVSWNIL